MEAIHGVDTSWLHKPLSRTNSSQPSPAVTPPLKPAQQPQQPKPQEKVQTKPQEPEKEAAPPTPNPGLTRSSSTRRPGFLNRSNSAEKTPTKSSWMSSISSKFSSSSPAPAPIIITDTSKSNSSSAKSPTRPTVVPSSSSAQPRSSKDEEVLEPYVPQQPKTSNTGFLSGALRRLSSSGSTSQGRSPTTGSSQGIIAPRMTLNIDKDRERCQIKELNQGKLRRVAFNVDVEIAGVSTHIPEDDVDADGMALDKRATARGEGEALKHPELAEGQVLGASTRGNNAGMWSSMSMTEDDWGTPPRSPKVPGSQTMGQKDGKRSMSPAAPSMAQKTGPSQPKLGRRKDAFNDFDDDWGEATKKTTANRGGPGGKIQGGEHDILKHLSGMDDEWGGKTQTASSKPKKSRTGSAGNGMFDSFTLDESDFDDAPKRNRSVSVSSQRRGSGNSTEPKRDMMSVLADDDWSDQRDSPAQGGTPTKRPSPTKGSPMKGSPAGPRPQTQPTAANNIEARFPRSPKPAFGRAQSTPAPLSLGQAGLPSGQPQGNEGKSSQAPVNSLLQAGQLAAPGDLPSRGTSASPAPAGTRPQDRPTTDPLRIYRRCCQLREAPVLKRISEQLSKPENFNGGIVGTLNLNKSRMQATDMVCLSDFLAVVPVKRLLLEDANIPDDGLRQILAGLLATKTPEVAKRRRGRTSPTRSRTSADKVNPGVIEKLSLKGNRKITEEGWKHLCLFINMSHSIRSLDVSLCPFPKPAYDAGQSARTIDDIFCKALVERPAGNQLYELLMADCGLTTQQVERVTRAASRGLERLGLANNSLTEEGLGFVARYVQTGSCHGIDLGGNHLRGKTHIFTKGLHERLLALSVANCNLLPADLDQLLPALAALPDLRLLDMSHNKQLFSGGNENATMAALRKQIPRFKLLKRIHLADCAMTPEHVIHIAEILPECRNLAHLNVLDNPAIKAVISDAADQAHQEEACALFASLMTAARLSKTLVCVDIDIPGPTASEVVKALARQVVAYCLRNIEAFTEADAVTFADAAAALPDIDKSNDSGIELLQHFLGHQDDAVRDPTGKAATEDYFVGGTGVVKALSYILSASQSGNVEYSRPGTPKDALESDLGKAQAKDMSRTLLDSARKYRAGLHPVLVRETNANNIDVLRRLTFLDDTLRGIIERFELEYPETRPTGPDRSNTTTNQEFVEVSSPALSRASSVDSISSTTHRARGESYLSDTGSPTQWRHTYPFQTDSSSGNVNPSTSTNLSRRESEVDLHNRQLVNEEGHMHRFGQRIRREVLPPVGITDHLHHTLASSVDPAHLAALREKYEAWGGDEFRQMVVQQGMEATIAMIASDGARLREMELSDPEAFGRYREAHNLAVQTGALSVRDDAAMEEEQRRRARAGTY